ncbi:hypothetical protein N7509_000712 [Penicillium cosmopolitanum]|uniref:Uncharacterized protein n=1 Tax=Penicillium cosmopolitanum TaxID=1131564 RepID=A0A9W9WAS7_9EURO|nr:uncharacterized protein N7509_000712 [Penicillium cosmopolitanum]KAJ5414085.1 hypothetical protein N7509_000712 [Penicillium cosmopolitanum]
MPLDFFEIPRLAFKKSADMVPFVLGETAITDDNTRLEQLGALVGHITTNAIDHDLDEKT